MNLIQNSYLKMLRLVLSFLNQNNTILANVPGVNEIILAIENLLKSIELWSKKQLLDNKVFTEQKKAAKLNLAALTYDVISKLVAFAKNTHNQELLQKVRFTKSVIDRAGDNKLKLIAEIAFEAADENMAAMVNYKLDADVLDTLDGAMTEFNKYIIKPKEDSNESKQATQQLSRLFKEAVTLLKNMDTNMEMLRISNSDIYESYWDSRKLPATNRRSLALKIKVTDADTKEGIQGVLAQVVMINSETGLPDSESEVIKKKTAKKGGAYIKSLDASTYQVTVSKNGYAQMVFTAIVNDGEMTYLEAVIKKL